MFGSVVEINQVELNTLDQFEGNPYIYKREIVNVKVAKLHGL